MTDHYPPMKTLENTTDVAAGSGSVHRLVRDFLDLRCMDCMKLMAEYPDKHFDLAIVDPPYAVGASDGKFGRGGKGGGKYAPSIVRNDLKHYGNHNKVPEADYFDELRRVSKNQIVWGANYYPQHFTHGGWIVWDKQNTGPLSDGELAYQSINKLVRIHRLQWSGFIKADGDNSKTIIHPNQKPVNLYNWLLANYAKKGDRILDTHMGSGSIAIACHYARLHLTASEIDEDYFKAACARIERETAQESFCFPNAQGLAQMPVPKDSDS
jgi:site-specific DNA-methyltransferase (adenine-specific)